MKGQKGGIPSVAKPENHEIAMLGHELGNVLNGLLGMAELLRDSGLHAEQEQWLKAIEQSGRQLRRLIVSFQSFKGGSGPAACPQISNLDGLALLEQVVISHTPAARANQNRLLLVVEPDVPGRWRCDPCMIRQLLDNLLGNANKFTHSGEVVLEAAVVPGDTAPSNMLELRVSDTGPGIRATDGDRIFDAYERKNGGDGCVDGNGLGLYICHNIVQLLNGRIDWSSPTGGGSCFDVVLPGVLDTGNGQQSLFPVSLLQQVQCRLKLENPLRRSVANFLTRLGVRWSNNRPALTGFRENDLEVLISEARMSHNCGAPALLLTPRAPQGSDRPGHLLFAPVLESTLGPLLLEMVLEWLGAREKPEP